jgi:hypothetical protein
MKAFTIEVQELLSRIVEVEANSTEEAVSKVREMYKNEEIVLDSDDYVTTGINIYPKVQSIDFEILSKGDNYYMIDGNRIAFWGKGIVSKIIELTPEALKLIAINDIQFNEPCRFTNEVEFKNFFTFILIEVELIGTNLTLSIR